MERIVANLLLSTKLINSCFGKILDILSRSGKIADVSTKKKLLAKLLGGKQDGNITFDEIMHLLRLLNYNIRPGAGSHNIISYPGTAEILNLQPRKDGKAKPYPIHQVRDHIIKYNTHAE